MGHRACAAVLSVAMLTACGTGFGVAVDCTDIGANPQVGLQTADGQELPESYSAEVCLDDACLAQPWKAGGRASVGLPLPDHGAVSLTVRTLDSSGEPVDEDRVLADVEPYSPNGPECEPTVGIVQLSRSADGAFRQVPASP
jgi:hypothetical protein